MVYLWRAVDAEGEVLNVPVQPKRNKSAALKLMRKLLRRYGFVPSQWSWMICGHTAPPPSISDRQPQSAVDGRTIEPRIRTGRPDEGRVRCNASRAWLRSEIPLDPRRGLQHIQRPTPPHFCPNTSHPARRGDEHVARCCRGRLKSSGGRPHHDLEYPVTRQAPGKIW